jgi:amidohydrolase
MMGSSEQESAFFLSSVTLHATMAPKTISAGLLVLASSIFGSVHLSSAASSPKPLISRQSNLSSPYLDNVSDYIDSIYDDLWTVNKGIHDNPELGYEEFEAHDLLTSFMEEQDGWNVTRSVGGVETAFKAVFDGEGEGPVVSFNAEYDALPELGHACGHNLIATASIGGALAAAKVMRDEGLAGKVILFGTPAEESLGGKIKMHEAGILEDAKIDISLISHPMRTGDTPWMITSSTDRFDVEYYGTEFHAAAGPWEGVNAQGALLLANSAIAYMRQQMRPTDRFHGIIHSGGQTINVIPALASGSYQIRADNEVQLSNLTERVVNAFEAGALGTGAELNFTMRPYGYANMVSNDLLGEHFAAWFEGLGGEMPDLELDKLRDASGSTDQGNLSHEWPSISPTFGIYTENGTAPATGPHTEAFEAAAGTKLSFEKALLVAKSLAGVAVDVLTVDGLLDEIKDNFEAGRTPQLRRFR